MDLPKNISILLVFALGITAWTTYSLKSKAGNEKKRTPTLALAPATIEPTPAPAAVPSKTAEENAVDHAENSKALINIERLNVNPSLISNKTIVNYAPNSSEKRFQALNDDDFLFENGVDIKNEPIVSDGVGKIENVEQTPVEEGSPRTAERESRLLTSRGAEHLEAGDRVSFTVDDTIFSFRFVPAGRFTMGAAPTERGRRDDETPHEVVITKPMLVMEKKVTRGQFALMYKRKRRGEIVIGEDAPILGINAKEAECFCQWLTKKLPPELRGSCAAIPTEAEWEMFARGGASTAFPFGDDWNRDKADSEPNGFGLKHVVGCGFEWTSDCYDEYPNEAVVDPIVNPHGVYRVVRGGSDDYPPEFSRLGYRSATNYLTRSSEISFRLVIRLNEEVIHKLESRFD